MARGALTPLISPAWRLMLLSDGSVTRHLQLLTDAKVRVDVLRADLLPASAVAAASSASAASAAAASAAAAVPDDVLARLLPERRREPNAGGIDDDDESQRSMILHREVDLCDGADGTPLVYASSWWTADAARRFGVLRDDGGATPRAVWMHLSDRRTELFREVRRMYRGDAPALERAWGVEGPFWARHYVFWAGGEPLCVIYEVFSPKLERFVGPQE